jgi:uncharacterized protein YjbJ (UPF0337 family)
VLGCEHKEEIGGIMKKSVEDRIQGSARQAKGAVKQEVGRVTRNRSMQAEGFVEKHAGKAQRAAGRSKAKRERDL